MSLTVGVPLFGTDRGRSGLSVYTRALLAALLRVDATVRLEVVGHADDVEALGLTSSPRLRVHTTPGWTRGRLGDWLWLRGQLGKWARRVGADVVLFPAGNRRVLALPDVPTVATVHDLGELALPDKYSRARRWRVRHEIVPALRRVDRVLTISAASQAALEAAVGLPAGEVPVIPNGVDPRFCPGDRVAARARVRAAFGLERPFFLYVARLEHPAKNHLTLLEAFARAGLAADHDLVLVGQDWPGCEPIYQGVRSLGLEGAVRRPGFVPDEDLVQLYRAAEALTFVSRFEGFGLPIVEALASGCPVVVSDREPMRGVAGEAGLRVDPEDPESVAMGLRQVLRPGVRERLVGAGLARAAGFSWDACAQATLRELRRAARGARALLPAG